MPPVAEADPQAPTSDVSGWDDCWMKTIELHRCFKRIRL